MPKRIPYLVFSLFLFSYANFASAEEPRESPIIINGDNVEYSTDNKEVTATGDIEVIYKGAKLTCNKLKVNMQKKEGIAEGNARLEDEKGVITGDKIIYDFQNKTGVILNAGFRSNPYFGKARKVEKVSDIEFVAKNGYITTCSMDHPHYRFAAKKVNMFPGDKMQTRDVLLYLGAVPVAYLPRFNYSMKEPIMHVQVEPGKRKEWGVYVLNTWRYNLTENSNALFSLDYRNKLGFAEGVEWNYAKSPVGKGDLKFYYTNEKPDPDRLPAGSPAEFQRYFLRWRHKWNIDAFTNITGEFYKITDKRRKVDSSHEILKDYFFREYEKDPQPLSYMLFHHSFNYSSLDVLLQMRTNHWFDQLNKQPEINYSLPNIQLWQSPFYFEDVSQFGNYNKRKDANSDTSDNLTVARFDTTNKFSLPMRVAFVEITPFASSRQTFYDKGANDQTGIIRTIFSAGADLSTKFYRIFDVKTNFLGLDINALRHIITPTVSYLYTHTPTIPGGNLKQIDSVDSETRGNTATLGLSNKLQTKRAGQSVDLVDFRITTDYVLNPKSGSNGGISNNSILSNPGSKLHSQFSDLLFELKVIPYSWMHFEGKATYEHSDRASVNYGYFSLANYDVAFDLGNGSSFSLGQRYERKGKNEITAGFTWRFSPKWRFTIYQRYNLKKSSSLQRGSQEQQYTLTRDLHCWEMDIAYSVRRNEGSTIYFTFRLKAFPENEFGFDQTTHTVKSGAQ